MTGKAKPRAAPIMVRVADAAVMLGVSGTTVRRWCTDGSLPFGWFHGQRRIAVADIERFVQRVKAGKL